jgi:DNA-binding NarL/FixJ family response regulator
MRQRTLAPTLIGREAPLAELGELLALARNGQGQLAFLTGEAGVGKSRLVEEFVRAAPPDVLVLTGHCYDEEPAPPYGPFAELLQGVAAPALPDAAPEYATAHAGETPADRLAARRNLFQRVHTLLRPGAERTHMLILEDLQWADEASYELLHYLARAAAADRICIIATYRSDAIHPLHPLAGLIARLTRDRQYHEIRLAPLDRGELAMMLTAILGEPAAPDLVQALYERTEGNPFFVEEVLGALLDQGGLNTAAAQSGRMLHDVELPLSIKDTILRRVAELTPATAAVMRDAAVIGRRFDFDLLARLSGLNEAELLQALSELVERQLITEEAGSEDQYRFRHELIRATLYEALLRRERRLRHKQVLDALEALHAADPAAAADQLAYHALQARDLDAAVRYSTLIGDRAARLHAYREALARYEDALEAGDQRGWPAERERARLLACCGQAAFVLGDNRRSAAAFGAALAIYQRLDDRRNAGDMQRWMGRVAWELDDVDAAFAHTHAALATLEGEPPCVELAMAQSALAHLYMLRIQVDSAAAAPCIVWGERALAMAEALGDDAVVCHALNSIGVALIDTGRVADGLERLERSMAIAHAADLPIDIVRGSINLGNRLMNEGAPERALAVLRKGWDYVQRHGILRGAHILFRLLAYCELDGGMWNELDGRLAAVRASDAFITPQIRSTVREIEALLAWCRGRLAEAQTALEALCREAEYPSTKHHLEQNLALILLDMGEHAEALRIADQIQPDESDLVGLDALRYAGLADLYFQVGRYETARHLLHAIDTAHVSHNLAVREAIIAELHGLDALPTAPAVAATRFAQAAELFEGLRRVLDGVRTRRRQAEALLRSKTTAEALAVLERARSAAAAIAYTIELDRITALIASAGQSPSADTPQRTPDGLTPRELEVLTLITRGLSNRAIAETLVISEKTAEVHVRNILSKLGLSSRTQAATYALEHGLVPSGRAA